MININNFLSGHKVSNIEKNYFHDYTNNTLAVSNEIIKRFLEEFGGASFSGGLFRIHTKGSMYIWSQLIDEFFPSYNKQYFLFGYDWMGRHYGISKNPFNEKVYMFDDSTNEVYELEQSMESFFNEDLVDYCDDTLNTSTFSLLENKDLTADKCYSFKVPLFLGGTDTIDNYSLIDMMVSWELNYQIVNKIKDFKDGQLINKVKFNSEKTLTNYPLN